MSDTKRPGAARPPQFGEAAGAPPPSPPPPSAQRDGFFTEAEADMAGTKPLGTVQQQRFAWIASVIVLAGAVMVGLGIAASVTWVLWLGVGVIAVTGVYALANHLWYDSERVDVPHD